MDRRTAVALVATLLLVPVVQATEGHGRLVTDRPAELFGAASFSAEDLTQVHGSADGGTWTARGNFTVVVVSRTIYSNGSEDRERTSTPYRDARAVLQNDSVVMGRLEGTLDLDVPDPDGYEPDGAPSAVLMPDLARVHTRETVVTTTTGTGGTGPSLATSSDDRQQQRTTVSQEVMALGNVTAAAAAGTRYQGPLNATVVRGAVTVHDDGRQRTYRTRAYTDQRTVCDQEVGGECVVSHQEQVTVVNQTWIRGEAVRVATAPSRIPDDPRTGGTVATMTAVHADRMRLAVNATLRFEHATGRIVVGEDSWELRDEPASIGGRLDVEVRALGGDRDAYATAFEGDVRYVKAPTATTFPPAVAAGAAVGAGILVAAVAYLWPALKFAATKLLIVTGYAHVEGDEVLENETRTAIFEAIQEDPGLSASDLAKRADCGWGTVVYHLAVLEQNGLVISTRDGRHRRFFPYSGTDFRHKDVYSAVQNETTAAILDAVRDRPGIHQKALRKRVGVAASTVNWHISKLEDAGLVEKQRDGRRVAYFPGPEVDVLDERAS